MSQDEELQHFMDPLCDVRLILLVSVSGTRNQVSNLALLYAYLLAVFSPSDGYRVLHVDLSNPSLELSTLGRLCYRSDVVLTSAGLPSICRLFALPSTNMILLDDCMLRWGNLELGANLHNMLR